jgi:hypothetical protein
MQVPAGTVSTLSTISTVGTREYYWYDGAPTSVVTSSPIRRKLCSDTKYASSDIATLRQSIH